jgi:hypothetical protein
MNLACFVVRGGIIERPQIILQVDETLIICVSSKTDI